MGKSKSQVVGYRHFVDVHAVIAGCRIDAIYNLRFDDKIVEIGPKSATFTVSATDLYGGDQREGGVGGTIELLLGESTQSVSTYLDGIIDGDVPAFRGVASFVFQDFYWGNNPYFKDWSVSPSRIDYEVDETARWYPEKATIDQDSAATFATGFINPSVHGGNGHEAGTAAGYVFTGFDPAKTYNVNIDGAWNFGGGLTGKWLHAFNIARDGDYTNRHEIPEVSYATEALALAAFVPFTITGGSTYTVYIEDTPIADNTGGFNVTFSESVDGPDINPAHIVYEALRDTFIGGAVPTSDIDSTSFEAAADTLYSEGFGLSLWYEPETQTPLDLINSVCEHVDAVHFQNRTDGKHHLKLIRSDYDPGDVVAFTNAEILDVDPIWEKQHEIYNRVSVEYWNNDKRDIGSISDTNPAGTRAAGRTISITRQFMGIRSATLAGRVLQRELDALTTPKITGRAVVNRTGAGLHPGDVVSFTSSRKNLAGEVMRVMNVKEGIGVDNRVQIDFIQDIFSLQDGTVVSPDDNTTAYSAPNPATVRIADEAPYFLIVDNVGDSEAQSIITDDPAIGFLLVAAGAPTGTAVAAEVRVDANNTGAYSTEGTLNFAPYASLDEDLSAIPTDTTVSIAGLVGLTDIDIGGVCQINDELMRVDAITSSSVTLGRGCYDTVPQAHADGSSIIFWQDRAPSLTQSYSAGDTPDVKLLPYNGSGVVTEAAAPTDQVTMARRAYRPHPVAQLQVEASYEPDKLSDGDSLTWKARNRLEETSGLITDFTDSDYTAEAGETYRVEYIGLDNTGAELAAAHYTNSSATTPHTISQSNWESGMPVGTESIRIKVTSIRDTYDSHQSAVIDVPIFAGSGAATIDGGSASATTNDSADGGTASSTTNEIIDGGSA